MSATICTAIALLIKPLFGDVLVSVAVVVSAKARR